MPQYLNNPAEQKIAQRHLNEAQKSSPDFENAEKAGENSHKQGKIRKALSLVSPANDGIFAVIIAGGILKDVADMMALAMAASDDSTSGAGFILPPMLSIMFQMFTTFSLLRKFAMIRGKIAGWKALVIMNIFQFIAGSFVGFSGWFPEATGSSLMLYYFMLKSRKKSSGEQENSSENLPEYA